MVNIPKVFQKTKEFVDDLDIGEFLENASIAEINEKLRSLTGKEKDDFIKQVNETGIPTSKPFEEKPKTKKQPEPEPEPEPEFIDESESKRTVGETYDVPDLPPLNQINKSIKLSDDIFPKIDEKGETFYDQPFEGDDIVTSWLDDIIPPGMKYDKAENIDFDVFLQTKKAGFQKTLNKLAEKTQNFKINPKTKELYEAGKLQLASDLQHVSVTDQLNLISRKQDKADKLREVRFQRLKKLQRDLRAQKLNKYKPILVTTDESVEPVTKFLTPDGYVIPYTKIYRKVNNFINRKDTNLITVPRGTLKARAEMAVMGHTMRGLSLKDPENIVRLANGDDQIRGALEEARDAFTPAMEKLLDQKDSLTQGPLREKLIQVARRYKPGLTESEINAHLLDLSHIFPFKKTGEVNPNSMFMGLGGNPEFIYLSPTYINRALQTALENKTASAIERRIIDPDNPNVQLQIAAADRLMKKLKALSILPVEGRADEVIGDTKLYIPGNQDLKLNEDDYAELLEYIIENDTQSLVGLPFKTKDLNEGGVAEQETDTFIPASEELGEIRPNITVEFGEPEEDSGMMDYLKDKAESFDRGLQTFVDEELDGNPARAVPVTIGNMLKAPGDLADSIRSKMDTVNQNIDKAQDVLELERLEALGSGDEEKFNQIVQQQEMLDRSRVSDFDKYVNFVTGPLDVFDFFFGEDLGNAYQNMFTDEDDTTLYLDPTGFFSDKKYTIEADSTFGKVVGAARTLGLTAAEVMLLFTPYQLLKLRKLDTSKLKKILAGAVNIGVPAAGFTYGYSSLPKNFQEAQEGLKQSTEAATGPTEPVQDFKKLQEAERDANVGVEMYNMKADGGLIEDELPLEFLENRDYAQTRLSRGGDPGQFTNPTSLALEEDFDARDILNEPGYESIEELDELFDITKREDRFVPRDDLAVQVAGGKGEGVKYILKNVPEWVRQGKERIKMGIQNILPGTREQPPGLPAVIDDTADGLTPLTKQEPGQIFYQQMEAELLQGPKVFKDKQAFFDYMQARNIGKVEVMDSEIERVIDSLTQKNMPITRETLIGVLRESPVRFVQSKGYGFLSDSLDGKNRSLKYSGYKEPGEIEGTSRERVLFVDPKDLRGDPGSVPGSVSQHNWEEPYTIAWSRLSDRDLGGKYSGKTVTFADEIQSDIFQGSQKMAGKLAAKIKYMADNNVPLDKIDDDIQREILAYFGDRKHVFRESLPSAAALKQEYDQLMSLQDQLRELANTPVPDMTDAMIEAAKKVQFQQADVLDNLTQRLNLDLNRYLFPNLPFKLRGQWADASIKRDIYEAAYRKFVLKDPNATDYYAVTPANLVTKRYSHEGTTATPAADRAADKERRIQSWVSGGMEGDIGSSRYPGVGMYEFYGGPGADVVTESGKHYTSEIEKILKRIARENNVPLEVLPVRIGRGNPNEVFNVVDRDTGQILGTGNTGRQADAIANDIIANSDRKVVVQRAEQFDTADSFGIELTPSMAEAFKAYMAKGGYVNEEILLPYGD